MQDRMHGIQKLAYERFNFTCALLTFRLIPFIADDTRKKAVNYGIIETLSNTINIQIKDRETCKIGCQILWDILMNGKTLFESKTNG